MSTTYGRSGPLQYQLHTTQKKRKLAEGLYTEEAEDEDKIPHDWENYLDRLLTLLLAYAMAGVTPRASVKDASMEKALGADSTGFVEVPLDVVMHYFYRAKRQSSILPLSQRLAWLEARDLEDRSDWVAKFRESSKSLGEVIKETCVARDALLGTACCSWSDQGRSGQTDSSASASGSDAISVRPGQAGEREEGGQGDARWFKNLPSLSAWTMQEPQRFLPPRPA